MDVRVGESRELVASLETSATCSDGLPWRLEVRDPHNGRNWLDFRQFLGCDYDHIVTGFRDAFFGQMDVTLRIPTQSGHHSEAKPATVPT